MIAYQWTSTCIAIVIGVAIIWLVRHNHLRARLAIWWVLLAVIVAVFGTFPAVIDWIAPKLGVSYSPTLVGLVAMAVMLIKILRIDIENSKEQERVKILSQKIAILEMKLRSQGKNGLNDDSVD